MDLGLTSDQFYELTPRQFDALARAHRRAKHRAIEHTEFLFAQLTAMVANTGFRGIEIQGRDKDMLFNALEFMPSRPRGAVTKAKRINRQAVAEKLRSNMAWLMARQNKPGAS